MASPIQDFADKVNADYAVIQTAVDGLTEDIKTLNDQIAALQSSSGAISAADQASLDAVEATAAGLASKISALDAQTAPPIAVTPPAP